MVEDIKFSVIDKDDKEKTYIIIDKFNKNNKNYIIYQEENNNDLYASLYEIIDSNIKIIPIENDKDYDVVDNYLKEL